MRTRTKALGTLSLVAFAGLIVAPMTATGTGADSPLGATANPDAYSFLPSTLELAMTIRDFKDSHPDFQSFGGNTTVGLVQNELGDNGLPALKSLRGYKIATEFRDRHGRNINPAIYDSAMDDRIGELLPGGTGNGFASAESFAQWYTDVQGVNQAKNMTLTLTRVAGSNQFVFDSSTHEPYASRGGFFPVDDELFGNYGDWGKNFHFTTEVRTQFVYERGSGQVFTFSGDDDVWVFIDGKLVIDLGGLHPRRVQTIELDRLDWLKDGEAYSLDMFHAERRTNQSNFRIETNIRPYTVELPQQLTLFD